MLQQLLNFSSIALVELYLFIYLGFINFKEVIVFLLIMISIFLLLVYMVEGVSHLRAQH